MKISYLGGFNRENSDSAINLLGKICVLFSLLKEKADINVELEEPEMRSFLLINQLSW